MKKFSKCHPTVNYMYYISTVIFGVIFRHPVLLCISFFACVSYYVYLSGKKAIKSIFGFFLPMILFVTFINGLTAHYGVTPLFSLPSGNNICLEPILYGFVTGVSAVIVIMIFHSYNKNVSSEKLMYILGGRFPKTAVLLTLSLRFVPLYKRKAAEIAEAQKGMGLGADSGKLSEKIKNSGRILGILISDAMENSIITSDSMKSRGYGLQKRTHFSLFRFTAFDGYMLALILLLDGIIIFAASRGLTFALYNPFFKINGITPLSFLLFFAYGILFLLPIILDVSEVFKWKKSE